MFEFFLPKKSLQNWQKKSIFSGAIGDHILGFWSQCKKSQLSRSSRLRKSFFWMTLYQKESKKNRKEKNAMEWVKERNIYYVLFFSLSLFFSRFLLMREIYNLLGKGHDLKFKSFSLSFFFPPSVGRKRVREFTFTLIHTQKEKKKQVAQSSHSGCALMRNGNWIGNRAGIVNGTGVIVMHNNGVVLIILH